MPRKNEQRKKAQQIIDENGWTHVIRGPRLASTELSRLGEQHHKQKLLEQRTASVLSLPEVHSKYDRIKEIWAKEPQKNKFEQILTTKLKSIERLELDNVIVLGLGSVAADNLDSSSMHQLVLFEHWISYLRIHFSISNIYFQDPRFHDNDRLFLTERGYTIIADPEAYLLLTTTTFLFAPYLPWEVMYTFYYPAYPALLVSNGSHTEYSPFQSNRSEILGHFVVKEFYAFRNSSSLAASPEKGTEKHLQWLQDMIVYWPKDAIEVEKEDAALSSSDRIRKSPQRNRAVPTETTSTNDALPNRVGPGEWRPGEGFVFDADFKQKLNQARLHKGESCLP